VALAPPGEVAKFIHVARPNTHNLLVSVHAIVCLELLATTLANKHLVTVLLNLVLVRRLQNPKSLVTDVTFVNTLSLSPSCALYFCAPPVS
jgi:hypothetical protein